MPTFIHQIEDWPQFYWDERTISPLLAAVSRRQGRLVGRMEAMGFELRDEAVLETLTEEVHKSSEIEGEVLDKDQVRSSIARRLGINIGGLVPSDRNVDGVVEMMIDATQNFAATLSEDRLYGWHSALFPTGRSGLTKITVGAWRDDDGGPMQVVSGAIGKERVHFQAPAASLLTTEMSAFLEWFEAKQAIDPLVKAALAHFWFVTIHPFDDGNGRVARAIADMALARSEDSRQRFYSMSAQIRKERNAYYEILERTQKGELDITGWMSWFLNCLNRAFDGAEETLAAIFSKAAYWEQFKDETINARQKKVINMLLDGFEGKLTSSKWAKITKTSPDTALRDITNLIERGMMHKDPAGGRSTSYSLGRAAH